MAEKHEKTPLGINLRRHRRQAGLTQAKLGAKAGVAQSNISALESGSTKATDFVPALAEALGIMPGDLDPRLSVSVTAFSLGTPASNTTRSPAQAETLLQRFGEQVARQTLRLVEAEASEGAVRTVVELVVRLHAADQEFRRRFLDDLPQTLSAVEGRKDAPTYERETEVPLP